MQFGIDVSRNNGQVDWGTVAINSPKVDFAILKATEGSNFMDKKFFANVESCVDNGIPWGAYHFATWNNEDEVLDAKTEAKFFLSIIKGTGRTPSLPLVLDIESNSPIPYTKQEMVAYVKTFIDEIIAAGYEPAIYSSPGFLNSYLPADHPFSNIKLWVADYTGDINKVPGWKKPWLHQYTDKGTVSGIKGSVDLNKVIA